MRLILTPTAVKTLFYLKTPSDFKYNFFSDKTTGPGEASKTSLRMSIISLPLKKNALKQQVIATSLGKVLVCKKEEQSVSVSKAIKLLDSVPS